MIRGKYLTHSDGETTVRIGGANVDMTYSTMLAIVSDPDDFIKRLRMLLEDVGVDIESGRIAEEAAA